MIQQVALLMAFQLIGEAVVRVVGMAFPGPLCGMACLLVYLLVKGGPSEDMSTVGTKLLDHLGLLFVPAGTAIVAYKTLLARDGMPILAALVILTAMAVLVSGFIAQRFFGRDQLD